MANTKISQLTNLTTPTWSEEFVYAYNNANGKVTLNTVKSFVWWAWITTLNADANIWELTDGTYTTAYDLYYKTWEIVSDATWWTQNQMLFVVSDISWNKWFFVFNSDSFSNWSAYFGYSQSSSSWECNKLWDRSWCLDRYSAYLSWTHNHPNALTSSTLTQILDDIDDSGTNDLRVWSNPYPWATYTIYVNSVKAWQTYTISLWTWVTNPLNITLPTASNKKCVITLLVTSSTTAIVTWCTIEA